MAVGNRLQVWMWVFRIACAIVLATGATATLRTHEEHWVERSGKVLVALALILTYAQFRYEVEHQNVEQTARDTAAHLLKRKVFVGPERQGDVLNRVKNAARTRLDAERLFILLNALAVAAIGELVSAFGGLVLEIFS
jgi:hypothetical protein